MEDHEASNDLRTPREEEEEEEEQRRTESALVNEATGITPLNIKFSNLFFTVLRPRTWKKPFAPRARVCLLKDLHGEFRAGEVTAIMGPSGAGKTTLMSVLGDRLQGGKLRGEILVNGVDKKRISSTKWSRMAAYVMQDDVMFAHLNPRETFWFSAQLRLPYSSGSKTEKIDSLIEELGLESCHKTRIGSVEQRGISGGQRKRVSIGMEMITDPSIIFLDEPTTGLDSSTSYMLVETLKRLAAMGRTIVMTIHQPSTDIFFKFDKLILMTEGHIIYSGPVSEVINYFAKLGYICPKFYNPAEFVMNLAKKDSHTSSREEGEKRVKHLVSAYRSAHGLPNLNEAEDGVDKPEDKAAGEKPRTGSSILKRRGTNLLLTKSKAPKCEGPSPEDIVVKNGPSFMYRLLILTWRNLIMAMRDPMSIHARSFQTIFFTLLIGLLYLQVDDDQTGVSDRQGALFFIIINQASGEMFRMVTVFPPERLVFIREHSMGSYTTLTYYISKLIAEAPFTVIFPTFFAAITYFMVGLQARADNFFIFLAALIVVCYVSQSLGLLLTAGIANMQAASALSPMVFIPLMLLGGYFLNNESTPQWLIWARYLSPFKYGFQIVARNEFTGLNFTCKPNESCIPTGEQLLANLDLDSDEGSIWAGFLFLFMQYFLYHTLAYLLLRFTAGRKKA